MGWLGKRRLEEGWADERRLEGLLRHPLELADGEARVLHREDGDRHETPPIGPREVEEPVVVGPRERPGGVRVLDHGKVLGKEGREEERPIDAHGVHVLQPGARVARAGGDRVADLGVEGPDVLGRHAWTPAGLAIDAGSLERAGAPCRSGSWSRCRARRARARRRSGRSPGRRGPGTSPRWWSARRRGCRRRRPRDRWRRCGGTGSGAGHDGASWACVASVGADRPHDEARVELRQVEVGDAVGARVGLHLGPLVELGTAAGTSRALDRRRLVGDERACGSMP